ncbi:S8/S53 family peptidase [Actinoplanes sp. LDG1-06]|uniref:S8/S53 family peptidase n=1 Tax=Paractinoplanes ovalisporus TaxID=2810368 RepID=A0ABS2A8W3_9ACTN|nr:S8/S53 family peptidase [Actinoplanes ovalisporus]MBM2616274.1 S8/S53 family peptidase [Actinoplanes ovalisporus]
MEAERYSADVLTFGGDLTAAKVEELNDFLDTRGHKSPLVYTGRRAGGRAVVEVRDGNATDIHETLDNERPGAGSRPDPKYLGGTFKLMGRHWGHGTSWSELPDIPADMKPPPFRLTKPQGNLRRPVVALLDSGVHDDHEVLASEPDDPFVLLPENLHATHRWEGRVMEVHSGDVSAAGHGTFIAGLIRMAAPSAQVLSLRVMDDEGRVEEHNIIEALEWLASYYDPRERPVDVVCMAFGREDHPVDNVIPLRKALEPLADLGIALVASAGNDHQTESMIYPAAFEFVTGLGAGFGRYHADFSNYGDWVDRYRDGVDVIGPMPGGKWARWSGTSFSAANFAGDLARPHVR